MQRFSNFFAQQPFPKIVNFLRPQIAANYHKSMVIGQCQQSLETLKNNLVTLKWVVTPSLRTAGLMGSNGLSKSQITNFQFCYVTLQKIIYCFHLVNIITLSWSQNDNTKLLILYLKLNVNCEHDVTFTTSSRFGSNMRV